MKAVNALVRLATTGLLLAIAGAAAAQQAYPNKPIRFVVPFSPGGSTDITARLIAEGLRQVLGQTVVVDNRPGAAGNIAADVVAKSPPNGYTLLVASATQVANISLYKNLPFDFVRDLAPVSQINSSTAVLVVSPNLPVNNLAEFIAYVKSGKSSVNYGSAGHGSSQHLAAALFNNMVAGNMVHVPYKGGAPAMTDLVAGEIQAIFAPLIEAIPQIRAGKVKALGVCGRKRSALVPDTPVIGDVLPGYEMASWTGILAPANTPADIVNKLSGAIAKVLNQPNVRASLAEADKEPVGSSPLEFKEFIVTEAERLRTIVKISGATVE